MLGKTTQLPIPRRVVVYYLLFGLVPVVWMVVGTILIATAVLREQHEEDALVLMRAASSAVTLELAKGENARLQSFVERLQRENSLQYAGIAGSHGNFIAHSLRDRIGEPLGEEEAGLVWGEVSAIRRSQGSICTREYRVRLHLKKEPLGTLVVSATEPGLNQTLSMIAGHTPFTLFGPLVLIIVGAVVLKKIVCPLAAIETQLRHAAVAASLGDVDLHPIKSQSGSAMGWNRLVTEFRSEDPARNLDRRLLEAVQSRKAERSDEVLNSLIDGVAVTDQQGRIAFANQTFSVLFDPGGAADGLRGRAVEPLLGFENPDDETASPLLDSEFRSRFVTDEVLRQRGNETQTLRIFRAPIRSTDRNAKPGHVWTVRDVTQQKLAEKMRDQFLSTATHELRTPLANIKAYAETLSLDDVIDVENQKEFLNVIITESTRLARFIDDLLSISSMEAGALALDRKECDLERMFADVVSKVKGQMEQKSIEFSTVFPEKWPQMKLDKDKFTVALVNLLGNAAKYTPAGGRVALKVKITEAELLVDVEDTGIGISEEELPRVFEKFFRSQSAEVQSITGTGIGLSMAQEVLELHGGNLRVESELGKGTTFTAVLPLKG